MRYDHVKVPFAATTKVSVTALAVAAKDEAPVDYMFRYVMVSVIFWLFMSRFVKLSTHTKYVHIDYVVGGFTYGGHHQTGITSINLAVITESGTVYPLTIISIVSRSIGCLQSCYCSTSDCCSACLILSPWKVRHLLQYQRSLPPSALRCLVAKIFSQDL